MDEIRNDIAYDKYSKSFETLLFYKMKYNMENEWLLFT